MWCILRGLSSLKKLAATPHTRLRARLCVEPCRHSLNTQTELTHSKLKCLQQRNSGSEPLNFMFFPSELVAPRRVVVPVGPTAHLCG